MLYFHIDSSLPYIGGKRSLLIKYIMKISHFISANTPLGFSSLKHFVAKSTTAFILLSAFVSFPTLVSAKTSKKTPKPNILFICVDDLVGTIGCYGDKTAKTPRIDALASQGTTFLNHHCAWSVCGPSRAAMTTSLTSEETGVMGFKPIRKKLPNVVTMPQYFKMMGYETAACGKYYDPRTVGDVKKPLNEKGQYPDGIKIDDPVSWSIPYTPYAHGHRSKGKMAWDKANLPDSEYIDYHILKQGIRLMKKISRGNKPFYLAVGFKKPHLPFVAPKKMWDLYDEKSMPIAKFKDLPLNVSPQNKASLLNNKEILGYNPFKKSGKLPTIAQQKTLLHGYYACASWVDSLVGQLLDELARTDDPVQKGKKMSETTIVVFWGDHGFHLGDHGRWAKHSNMERATSCPLIVYDPRTPGKGAKTTSPVSTLDIYPTLCALAGLPVPDQPKSRQAKHGRPLRGVNFAPLLKNPSASVRKGALTVFSIKGSYGYAYRTKQYRYIEWVNKNNKVVARDLYDYKKDPLETKNLINDRAYADVVKTLARALRADPSSQGCTRLQASSSLKK